MKSFKETLKGNTFRGDEFEGIKNTYLRTVLKSASDRIENSGLSREKAIDLASELTGVDWIHCSRIYNHARNADAFSGFREMESGSELPKKTVLAYISVCKVYSLDRRRFVLGKSINRTLFKVAKLALGENELGKEILDEDGQKPIGSSFSEKIKPAVPAVEIDNPGYDFSEVKDPYFRHVLEKNLNFGDFIPFSTAVKKIARLSLLEEEVVKAFLANAREQQLVIINIMPVNGKREMCFSSIDYALLLAFFFTKVKESSLKYRAVTSEHVRDVAQTTRSILGEGLLGLELRKRLSDEEPRTNKIRGPKPSRVTLTDDQMKSAFELLDPSFTSVDAEKLAAHIRLDLENLLSEQYPDFTKSQLREARERLTAFGLKGLLKEALKRRGAFPLS